MNFDVSPYKECTVRCKVLLLLVIISMCSIIIMKNKCDIGL